MRELDAGSRLAAALLIAALAVARSPSSAIAIIEEMHAKGPFTTTCLTVTVLMDVVVVLLFALTQLVVNVLVSEQGSSWGAGAAALLLQFLGQTLVSILLGIAIGKAAPLFCSCTPRVAGGAGTGARGAALAVLGGTVAFALMLFQRAVFVLTGWVLFLDEELEMEHAGWSVQNPLICCMAAGFVACNFTRASDSFHATVHDLAGPIYLVFFTFTGITMDLGVLWRNRSACVLLFTSRALCIVVGSSLGGWVGRQPAEFTSRYWMAFLTQAGVTLGLAQAVASRFVWGPDFSACIVALVVCNQIVGPPLFKAALKLVREDNHGYHPKEAPTQGKRLLDKISALGNPATGAATRPKPRGALVLVSDGEPVGQTVTAHLRALSWEVLVADETLSVHTNAEAARLLDRRSNYNLGGLPERLVRELRGAPLRPWEVFVPHRSLPSMRSFPADEHYADSGEDTPDRQRRASVESDGPPTRSRANSRVKVPAGRSSPFEMLKTPMAGVHANAGEERSAVCGSDPLTAARGRGGGAVSARASGGARAIGASLRDIFGSVADDEEPITAPFDAAREADPQKYAQSMRLLWLAASMKNLDVILVLLRDESDVANACRLVTEMLDMIGVARKRTEEPPPQLVVSLPDGATSRALELLSPAPFIIRKDESALPHLVCEVLHPLAHYTGSFEPLADEAAGRSLPSSSYQSSAVGSPAMGPSPPHGKSSFKAPMATTTTRRGEESRASDDTFVEGSRTLQFRAIVGVDAHSDTPATAAAPVVVRPNTTRPTAPASADGVFDEFVVE